MGNFFSIGLLFFMCSFCWSGELSLTFEKSDVSNEGSNVKFTCSSSTRNTVISGVRGVIAKNGTLVAGSSSMYNYTYTQVDQVHTHLVVIKNVSREDGGPYICSIIVNKLPITRSRLLYVNYKPSDVYPVCKLGFNSTKFLVNDSVEFSCKSQRGFPHIKTNITNSKASLPSPRSALEGLVDEQNVTVSMTSDFNQSEFRCQTKQTSTGYKGQCVLGPITIYNHLKVYIEKTEEDKVLCTSNIPHSNKTWILSDDFQKRSGGVVMSDTHDGIALQVYNQCIKCNITCQVQLGNLIQLQSNVVDFTSKRLPSTPSGSYEITKNTLLLWSCLVMVFLADLLWCFKSLD